MEQVLLKDGPLNGTRVHVEPGQNFVTIAERAGPATARSRSMPPEIIVAKRTGRYSRSQGIEFMWCGWVECGR